MSGTRVGDLITFRLSANTAEPLEVVDWYPGESWQKRPVFPLSGSYFSVIYTSCGVKVNRMVVRAKGRNTYCNGDGTVTRSVTLY